jgi:hypothetical protein
MGWVEQNIMNMYYEYVNSNIYVDVRKPFQEEGKMHSNDYCLYHIIIVKSKSLP